MAVKLLFPLLFFYNSNWPHPINFVILGIFVKLMEFSTSAINVFFLFIFYFESLEIDGKANIYLAKISLHIFKLENCTHTSLIWLILINDVLKIEV